MSIEYTVWDCPGCHGRGEPKVWVTRGKVDPERPWRSRRYEPSGKTCERCAGAGVLPLPDAVTFAAAARRALAAVIYRRDEEHDPAKATIEWWDGPGSHHVHSGSTDVSGLHTTVTRRKVEVSAWVAVDPETLQVIGARPWDSDRRVWTVARAEEYEFRITDVLAAVRSSIVAPTLC